ncbi:MAG: sulfotransferase [Bacteroidetes bacterium]|nr:sulfotransferase [Bacteroidota bacterium]
MPTPTISQQVQNIPVFFILGRPRSGTTLLRTLFDAHPNVTTPVECAFIINMNQKYGKIRSWTKDMLLEFYEDVQKHIKFDTWNINLDTLKADLLECEGENTFQNVCKVVYFDYESLFPKEEIKWIGDKNPVYATYTPELLKLFPDAKFIHLIRDPRDNIISLKNVDFEGPFTALLAYRWEHSARKLHYIKKKHPDKFYTIRYEDLVSEPTKYYRELCDFLSIPYNDSVFEFYKIQGEAMKKFNVEKIMKYHKSLLSPINTKKVNLWKTELPERDIRITEFVAGRWIKKSGYERRYRWPGFVAILYSIPWLIYGRALYLLRDMIDKLPFNLKIAVKNRGPVLARTFVKLRNSDT